MIFKLIQFSYLHCVFTIDKKLWIFFLKHRTLLNCLFHPVRSVVSRMFFKINQAKNFTPGVLIVLHTFGRDLKYSHHIHCLISESGLSDNGFWKPVKHFNHIFFGMLSLILLLKKVKTKHYDGYKQDIYVYAKLNLCNSKTIIPRKE